MDIPSLKEANLQGKTVLVRFDYNVPLEKGQVLDDTRLQASLPTLNYLLKQQAKVIILSHLGRPSGIDPALSLKPIAQALEGLLHRPVGFCSSLDQENVNKAWQTLPEGAVLCLENLRFWPEEESNDSLFSQKLASLGDIYVNDAFSVSHRAHASVEGITYCLPSYGGLHFLKEIEALAPVFTSPKPPIAAIVGGSKVSTKFKVLKYLMEHTDHVVIAGGMANTFLVAQGYDVGNSLHEPDLVPSAKELMAYAQDHQCTLHVPQDVVAAPSLESPSQTVDVQDIPSHTCAYDIGPQTLAHIKKILGTCQTILWNGPLGVFEKSPFHQGSVGLAHFLGQGTQQGHFYTVAGGGETVAVLQQAGVMKDFSYVSTAGGAFLEFIEGKPLPGVQALKKRLIPRAS